NLMFAEIYQDLKYQLRIGGFTIAVIFICIAIFIVVNIYNSYLAISGLSSVASENIVLKYISLSNDLMFNLAHPWVWVTHIFTHVSFFHLLWNLMNLYWFGMIVEDLIGRKHLKIIFFVTGIAGGIFFLISAYILPWYKGIDLIDFGTSAAVMGLILAATTISPDYSIRLLLIGNIRLKYLTLVLITLDLLFIAQNDNSGGRAAHLGGAFFGYLYIILLRNGVDISKWLTFRKKKPAIVRSINRSKPIQTPEPGESSFNKSSQQNLDRILEKIKNKGIESLSSDEKNFLDQQSKQS
ncbi:MAG: rhomboid family intramembrane serine protease, partial [Saprospiraceae bacterium]|nr:rhomboid family intramembrane serine protease [Saprospiraceae bacterium]